MNYIDVFNLLNTGGRGGAGAGTNGYTTWYNDYEPMKKSIDDTIRSIWYSDGRNEIEVKEEKKNGKTESEVCSSGQRPDDGCIYW